jgi:NADP-dependent 3-hydroxy acid dehydrogenase YdfG
MAKTILINGYGPGISQALAEKFGAEGYAVGLVARSADRLAAGVAALEARGIVAAGFQADLADLEAIPALVQNARDKLGPLNLVHWNAYGSGAGDLLASEPAEVRGQLDLAVTSLIAVVKAALPDLRATKGGVLVTNGGLGLLDAQVDAGAVRWQACGLAIANAAKHKLVRLLAEQLRSDGVYVGEVVVLAAVKGTAWDNGSSTLEASSIAAKFWEIYNERRELSVQVGDTGR